MHPVLLETDPTISFSTPAELLGSLTESRWWRLAQSCIHRRLWQPVRNHPMDASPMPAR